MTTGPNRRIPTWLKVAYSVFVAILVPIYWVTYSPWNFLYFCDVALLVTAVAIWIENPLLISMQAIAITVPQMRQVFARLLRHPAPSPEEIAEVVSRVLRRNEESRIYHWHKATGTFPPRRPRPNTS